MKKTLKNFVFGKLGPKKKPALNLLAAACNPNWFYFLLPACVEMALFTFSNCPFQLTPFAACYHCLVGIKMLSSQRDTYSHDLL